jgi:hypothetical protein
LIGVAEIAAYGRCLGPHVALQFAMVMLRNTQWVRQHDGWTKPPRELLVLVGLDDRQVRERAVRKAVALGWIETRRSHGPGSRLEYRLRFGWQDGVAAGSGDNVVILKPARNVEIGGC